MISCNGVAKMLSSDELSGQPWWKRAEVRLHLLMCKYCSRFAGQLAQLRIAARRASGPADADPQLEERIISRLSRKGD
jgi:predicted anti-sigma-YlaC factor YlaD